ncbi:Rad2 nuclease [Coniosporium apollinis]|uniref:Rad2 nuclease n=1 Tax=Coniosporium apollinis TaxID=61459 RepID=A0ABQ9NNT7_9PEZI|nr:Rad2 nuclease [Coniosporium apollinis]
MSRVRMLVHFGITPYLVFDGDYLPSKSGTEKERAARRRESKKTGLELLKLGKTSQAHLELQKSVDVTPEMARLLIDELKIAGIRYIVAPYEADSQMAYLERKGIIDGILSEDSDLLVFGAKCLITKLDQYGDCVVIHRDDFTACREISLAGWSDAEFRRMAILSGCDYLASIANMGLKTAYRLIRKHKTVERTIRAIQFDGQFKVPPSYLEAFYQAEMTFLYQWVYCPLAKTLVNCTDPEPGVDVSELLYIGKYVDAMAAAGVARGDLHPHTKEPIVVDIKTRTMRKPLAPASRQQTEVQTPDLKRNKSIDSFFKPRRTPLAELDPNCFTPSPSQQRLLEQNPSSWLARPASARFHSTSIAAAPSSAPQPSRRSVSDSWSSRASVAHPSKRQRLCSDNTPGNMEDAIRVESGSSRFFASATTEPSPSVRTGRKTTKAEFNLWSDESIEDAMADLPDPDDFIAKPKKTKRLSVFADDMQSSTQTTSAADSQSTIASATTSQTSQTSFFGTATPATSFGSPPESQEEEPSLFDEALSPEVKSLRAKFTYQAPEPKSAVPSRIPKATTIIHSSLKLSRTSSAPIISMRLSRCEVASQISVPEPPPKEPGAPEAAEMSADYQASPQPAVTAPQKSSPVPDQVEDRDGRPDLDDSTWLVADAETVVPASSPPKYLEDSISKVRRTSRGGIDTSRGSEDLLIPDSEAEDESDSPDEKTPVLDLRRFAFVAS